jgi:O-antigen/teichoic acid export membrane protein
MSLIRSAFAMTTSSAVALVATAGGYVVYSSLLSPAEFAYYAGALALARFASLLVDSGLKVSLVTSKVPPNSSLLGQADFASKLLCIAVVALVALGLLMATLLQLLDGETALFLGSYALAYFVTYPFLLIPLVHLERGLIFNPIAHAEGIGVALEYSLPAILWITVYPSLWVFVLGAWVGRIYRVVYMRLSAAKDENYKFSKDLHKLHWGSIRLLLNDGWNFQLGSLASMVRDNLHLIFIGPIYGKEWAGFYTWIQQLCASASQIFVQTASRISLPWLASATNGKDQWTLTIKQIQWLTIFTFPAVASLLIIAPAANIAIFNSKWLTALPLLPFYIIRMLPSIGTTIIGSLVMTRSSSRGYLSVNFYWTLVEVAILLPLLYVAHEYALAISHSLVIWLGLFLMIRKAGEVLEFKRVIKLFISSHAVIISLILSSLPFLGIIKLGSLIAALMYSFVMYFLCILSEPVVRDKFLKKQNPPFSKK